MLQQSFSASSGLRCTGGGKREHGCNQAIVIDNQPEGVHMKTAQALLSILWLGGALLCGNAVAGETVTKERVVSYADLNLNNPAGVQKLYRRISAAARSVCGLNEALSVQRAMAKACTQKAIDDAVTKVSNHNLSAYHAQKIGKGGEPKVAAR
jgi:UrcA family protein